MRKTLAGVANDLVPLASKGIHGKGKLFNSDAGRHAIRWRQRSSSHSGHFRKKCGNSPSTKVGRSSNSKYLAP